MHPNLEQMNSPYSPSFSTLFNNNLAETAARVTRELEAADEKHEDLESVHDEEDEDEDEFEFNLSDSILAGGDCGTVYPVFDRHLLRDFNFVGEIESRPSNHEEKEEESSSLFLQDRSVDPPSSSSSSEADDFDGIPQGTYCVWTPNKSPSGSASPGRCTKSGSTGSSATEKLKGWKLRDLMKRSKSDGKDGGGLVVLLLTPTKKAEKTAARGSHSSAGAGVSRKAVTETATRERKFVGGEKNKRRSYLPYRQDLVGFFASPQALRKSNFRPTFS